MLTETVNMGDIIEVDERAETAGIVELIVGPVSYTHLDVYKRQALPCTCEGSSTLSTPFSRLR